MARSIEMQGDRSEESLCHLYPVDILFKGPVYGASVVHTDLLRAVTRSGRERRIHLVLDADPAASQSGLPPECVREIALLDGAGEGTVSVHPLLDLQAFLQTPDTVTITSGPDAARVLAARRICCAAARSPVCTLCHSLIWRDFIATYAAVLRFSESIDHLVVPTRRGRDALTACLEFVSDVAQMPVPTCAVTRIPYGVWPEKYDQVEMAQCRRILGIAQEPLVLCYLGRLTDKLKADLDCLLVATARLRHNGVDATLLIAGAESKPGYAGELRAHASVLGLDQHLVCLEDFDEVLKPLILGAADICVFPVDNLQETFGLAILEAMAARRPVVASRWSGYSELIEDGVTGFLVDCAVDREILPDIGFLLGISRPTVAESVAARSTSVDVDALEQALGTLAKSKELRKTLGEHGRRRVEQEFAWPVVVKAFEALWAEQREAARTCAQSPTMSLRPGLVDKFIEAYSGRISSPDGLAQTDQTAQLLVRHGLSVLSLLPSQSRADARELLLRANRGEAILKADLTPEMRGVAQLLLKKGLASPVATDSSV